MRKLIFIFFISVFTAILAFYAACIKPPEYSVVPFIELPTFSSATVQGCKDVVTNCTDSVNLVFSFTDGDGDLGPANASDTTLDIFLTDSRDHSVKKYRMPDITPIGNIKSIKGDVTITIKPFSCRAGHDSDTLSYAIYVVDRAGHESNTIRSPRITVNCQ